MRRIYDVRCTKCNEITEVFGRAEDDFRCGACSAPAKTIVSPGNFTLDGTSGDFPGAAIKWARDHERRAKKG